MTVLLRCDVRRVAVRNDEARAFRYHAPKTVDEAVRRWPKSRPMTAACWPAGRAWCRSWRSAWRGRPISSTSTASRRSRRLAVDGDQLAIGACVRHAAFHRPVVDGPLGALLREVVRHIAHYPIRTRGTFCGSVAHADPASEWCLVAATLDAEMVARSARGTRRIPAADFFHGIMTTALAEDELLIEVRLPILPADTRFGFYEFNRRAGDFALGHGAGDLPRRQRRDRRSARRVGGAEPQPRRIAEAQKRALARAAPDAERVFEAAAAAAAAAVDPIEDMHHQRRLSPRPGRHRDAARARAGGRMSEKREITLTINGRDHAVRVEPRRTLVDAIRDDCGQTGTHIGCEHGVCGACTVLVDGEPVRSCLMFAVQARGRRSAPSKAWPTATSLHPLQQAFIEQSRRCNAASARRAS